MSLPLSLLFIPLLIFLLKSWESITSVRDYCTYMVFIIAQQTDYVGNYYCWTILEKLLLLRESVCRLLVPSRLSAILGAIPIYVLPLLNCLFCIVLKSFLIWNAHIQVYEFIAVFILNELDVIELRKDLIFIIFNILVSFESIFRNIE